MTATQGKAFRLAQHSEAGDGVWAVHFDLQGEKVNKLSTPVMTELDGMLESLKARADIKVLAFLSDKEGIFIAGADIEEIKPISSESEGANLASKGQAVIEKLENLPFPVVACINGASMGGGTELALCCKYIVVSDGPATKIALPEVNLGILPGFGGTVRMPKRIGLQTAMDYILTGKPMNGEKAFKIGFADGILPSQDFNQRAIQFAAKVSRGEVRRNAPRQALPAKLLEGNPLGRAVLFSQARKMIMSKTRGKYPAPLKILELLADNAGRSKKEALKRESKAFGVLGITTESKRLIDLFFAMEGVKKLSGVPGKKLEAADKVASIGLLGAGVMGGGIAQLGAHKNFPVRMKDIDYKGLALGMNAANRVFSGLVKKRKMTKRELEIKLALISPTTDYTGFNKVDVVIEAVVENMDVKKKVLQECESHMKDTAFFASNTSSLSITEMAMASKRPENVVGLHFFNPVHKMPLIEVVRGAKTSDRAVMAMFELSKKLGKTPIVVKDGPGFLVNRLLMPYLNEASYILAEGTPVEELDEAVLDFGMPMGPATLLDEVGIDVGSKVAKILHEAFGRRAEPCPMNPRLVDAKCYGKKTSKGFYLYDSQGKKTGLNPDIYNVMGVTPKSPSKAQKDNWIPRMMYPILNEAALCLAEGIVATPQDVDLGMIMGTGFPPFRGGPLRYADSIGAEAIVKKLEELAKTVSPRFAPSEALVDRARKGLKFYS